MKRAVLYGIALFSVIVFGWLAYTNVVNDAPEGVIVDGNTARVMAEAAYNMWGEDGNGNGRKEYRLTEPVSEEIEQWLKDRGYERVAYEPHKEIGVADSLGMYPLFIGFVVYSREE